MNKTISAASLWLVVTIPAWAINPGDILPECPAAQVETNKPLDFSVYKGKVVLVDFWATWCSPCLKSMPFFNTLRNELASQGFEIVAINVDEDSELARQFLQSHPVDYVTSFDADGHCPALFEVKAMPSSYLVDKIGKVRFIHLGYRDSDQESIRQEITKLLSE